MRLLIAKNYLDANCHYKIILGSVKIPQMFHALLSIICVIANYCFRFQNCDSKITYHDGTQMDVII